MTSLACVLRQQDVELEVVVVDDGSGDETAAILTGLDDRRVRVITHDTPRGVVAARNTGIAAVRGKWVAFCDDDDLWAPQKLARQLHAADKSGRSWVYVGSVDIDLENRVLGGAPPVPPEKLMHALHEYNAVPGGGSGVMARATLLEQTGGFDRAHQGTHMEDWELWLRFTAHGAPGWVLSPLVGYRVHPANASLDVDGLRAGLALLEHRHALSVDRGAFFRHLCRACLRSGRYADAACCIWWAARRGRMAPLFRELAGTTRAQLRQRLGTKSRHPHRHAAWHAEAEEWLDNLTPGRLVHGS